jgi:hypothetical protein
MTNQPDPWAQARRISAEWEEARRDGADRPTVVSRVKAARARRAAAMSEARIKDAVTKAVREALASPEFAESVDQYTQAAPPASAPGPAVPQVPDKPLHEMTPEQWDAHRRAYWQAAMPDRTRILTLGDLMGRPAGGDEA